MRIPRYIALDLDGTLLNPEGRVSPRNLAALRLAEASGAQIIIATGRRHAYAMRVLTELALSPSHIVVSSNGTVTRTVDARLIRRQHLRLSTARWLCQFVGDLRSTLVLTFDNVGPDGQDTRGALMCEALEDLHASIGRWMEANAACLEHVSSFAEALAENPEHSTPAPIQAMMCGTVDRMRRAEALLTSHPAVVPVGAAASLYPSAEITLHRTVYPDRDLAIVDILPAGCSKASALQQIVQLQGLSMANVLAIGDNWNDLPMLQSAGTAILMGNAPSDLQAIAAAAGWRVTSTNNEDGVAAALEDIFAEDSLLASASHY